MSIEATIVIALLTFLIGALSIYAIMSGYQRLEKRLSALEQAEEQRRAIVCDARGRERSHHAYNTLKAIEDATALLIDAELDLEAMRARQETALGILRVLRKGPNEYKQKEDRG
jgi:hypothetical protein